MSLYFGALFMLMIVSMAHAGEKVCPGYGFIRPPTNCESTCSQEKDECGLGKKCCFRVQQPCGFQCIVPKDNQPKAGKCPSPSSDIGNPQWGLCDAHLCDVDGDCKAAEKCCHNLCGAPVCVAPQ